jgi:hypothetical protein
MSAVGNCDKKTMESTAIPTRIFQKKCSTDLGLSPPDEDEESNDECMTSERKRQSGLVASLERKVKRLKEDNDKQRSLLEAMEQQAKLLAKCNQLLVLAQLHLRR